MNNIDNESEKIELFFSLRNLPNLDTFSKTDAKIILYGYSYNKWIKLGETEVIYDNLNPDFSHTIIVDYYFEKQQKFKIEVIDIDNKNDHSNFDNIGYHEFTLGAVIGYNKAYYKELNSNHSLKGTIIIKYDKVCKLKKKYSFDIKCSNLNNKRFCLFKSSPFLKFYKYKGNKQIDSEYANIAKNNWVLTYQTNFVKSNLNPSYNKIQITSSKFNSSDNNLPLKVEVWDYYSSGSHKLMGYQFFRFSEMEGNILNIKIISKSEKNNENISILNIIEENDYDFIDYVRSGLQIQNCIAIDFTASNLDPCDTRSLHYIDGNEKNLYEKSIYEISNILINYDYDKEIPLFGFGFKFPNNPELQKIFPLSFDWNQTTIKGIDSIMNTYRNALNSVIFSGPTFFSPILKTIINIIKNQDKINEYYVLTILTDGIIHDMQDTIDLIVEGSSLPLSIIIIGIGNEDFTNMNILDGDNNSLINSKGIKWKRDIVQFVPFREFKDDPIALTKEVLFEIPYQINSYSKLKNITPNNNLYKKLATIDIK